MESRPTFIYSSEEQPRLLKPAKPEEDHIWYRPDGKTFKLDNGTWREWSPEGFLDA